MLQISECATQYIDLSGKVHTIREGVTVNLPKLQPNFRRIGKPEGDEVDFAIAGEEELLEANYDLKDLVEFADKHYKKKIRTKDRDTAIAKFLDARFRFTEEPK
jgi:hypothetical protein